jgi:hypothetical protein
MATPALRGETLTTQLYLPPHQRFGVPFYWVSPHLVKCISTQHENFFTQEYLISWLGVIIRASHQDSAGPARTSSTVAIATPPSGQIAGDRPRVIF